MSWSPRFFQVGATTAWAAPLAVVCSAFGGLPGCTQPAASETAGDSYTDNVPAAEIIWRPKDHGPPQALSFESLRSKIDAGDVQLSNGQAIEDPTLWEAVVISKAGGGRYCTAAVIGPNVLLTAAHCVDARSEQNPQKTIGGTVRVDGYPLQIKQCSMPKAYFEAPLLEAGAVPRSSHDYALCEFGGKVGENVILESLSAAAAQQQQPILMSGYGCINIRVFAGAIEFDDGEKQLRVGEAGIEALDVLDSGTAAGEYLRTRTVDAEPILCPGDSGGPAFAGATLDKQDGPRRRVIAVNSKVVAVPSGGDYQFLSFMSAVNSTAFEAFRVEWRGTNPARDICGREIAPGSRSCRN